MGSWNETCYVSSLPIRDKEEAVAIVLTPSGDNDATPTCYHNDKFVPLGFAVEGQYNDYGTLVNIQAEDFHTGIFENIKPYYTNKQGEYVKYAWVNLSQFIQDVNTHSVWVNTPFDGYRVLTVAFVHKQLYRNILANMSKRLPFGSNEIYFDKLYARVDKAFALDIPPSGKSMSVIPFCSALHLDFMKHHHLGYMFTEYAKTKDDDIKSQMVHYLLWNKAMSISRHGYCCNVGMGGQETEYQIPRLIAEFILNKCIEYADWRLQSDPDVEPERVLEEDCL